VADGHLVDSRQRVLHPAEPDREHLLADRAIAGITIPDQERSAAARNDGGMRTITSTPERCLIRNLLSDAAVTVEMIWTRSRNAHHQQSISFAGLKRRQLRRSC
jgi:hypothetical protein